MATVITRYIDELNGSSEGNGTIGDPYSSYTVMWNALRSEFNNSLVTADVQVDVILLTTTTALSSVNTASNAVLEMDATRFLRIIGDWDGTEWDDTKARIIGTGLRAVQQASPDNFVVFEGVQFRVTGSSSTATGVYIVGARSSPKLKRCLIDLTNQTDSASRGLLLGGNGGAPVVENSVILLNANNRAGIYHSGGNSSVLVALHNTIKCNGASYGILHEGPSGNISAINCGVVGSSIADYANNLTWGSDTDYNASSDATAPGTNSKHNVTPNFGGTTYQLDSSDTAWKDSGLDLSGYTIPVTVDITGATRIAPVDIGAFEASGVVLPTFEIDKPRGRRLTYSFSLSDDSDPSDLSVGEITYIDAVDPEQEWIVSAAFDPTPVEGKLWLNIDTGDETTLGLPTGTYRASIEILHPTATNSGDTITVTLVVT